jgi:DNA-binding PadR family transcriptional regulator
MSSTTRLLVLGVVKIFQPVHGYDVRRELMSWRADEWASISAGSIYNALKSMTRDGLLEVVGTGRAGARPERTTYRLTPEGESEYGRMLRETWWNVHHVHDPLLPAISFVWSMPRDEVIAALNHRLAQIDGMRGQLGFTLAQPRPDTVPEHVQEMLLLMSERLNAEAVWAKALLGKLAAGKYTLWGEPAAKREAKVSKADVLEAKARKRRGAPAPARGRGRPRKRT